MGDTRHEEGHDSLGKIDDDELRALLERLHAHLDMPIEEPQATSVTIRDVVEATGLSQTDIQRALEDLREERLTRVLNELEEPLHRVERPGHTPVDPVSRLRSDRRYGAIRSILDHLPRADMVVFKSIRKRSDEEIREDHAHHRTSMLVIWILMALMGLVTVSSVLMNLIRR